jgi:UPF0271 protein
VIDLNSDVGEGYGAFAGGPDDDLLPLLTSANVACGGHAGDPSTMRRTCRLAAQHDVVVGAQVSYPDLVGFGRRFIDMAPSELTDTVLAQAGALEAIARACGTQVRYLKPHGALYNTIVHHEQQARAVVTAAIELRGSLPVLGLPGSAVERECARRDHPFVAEGFADRAYTSEGTLVPRSSDGALIVDPVVAAAQAVRLAESGVRSVCVHSDTPGAAFIVAAVRQALVGGGFRIVAFAPKP